MCISCEYLPTGEYEGLYLTGECQSISCRCVPRYLIPRYTGEYEGIYLTYSLVPRYFLAGEYKSNYPVGDHQGIYPTCEYQSTYLQVSRKVFFCS